MADYDITEPESATNRRPRSRNSIEYEGSGAYQVFESTTGEVTRTYIGNRDSKDASRLREYLADEEDIKRNGNMAQQMIRANKERKEAMYAIANEAFNAMVDSVANEGQKAALERLRTEFVGRHAAGVYGGGDNTQPDFEGYMSYWRNRLDAVISSG